MTEKILSELALYESGFDLVKWLREQMEDLEYKVIRVQLEAAIKEQESGGPVQP